MMAKASSLLLVVLALIVVAATSAARTFKHSTVITRNEASWVKLRGGGGELVRKLATLDEVEDTISDAGDKLVLLYFTATWCGPCQAITPVLEMIAADVGDKAVIVKVDVDENSETASNFDVYQMPTFIFLRSGEVVHQFSGARPDVLKAKVAELSEGAAAPDDAEEGL